jgi:Putative Zn-dependent protease, contains TPR repeats
MRNESNRTGNSDTLNQRGIELANRGWLEEALREFGRAIDLDRNSPFPRINRASVYLEQGRSLDALEDLLAAVRLAPEDPTTHYHLGVLLSQCGSALALGELQTALNQDPEGLDILIQLGCTYADRGEYREAEQMFKAALALEPDDPFANHEFGIFLMDHGHIHEAIARLKLALVSLPKDPEIEIDLAMAFIQAGFYDQAITILSSVIKRQPDNLHAYYNVAAIHANRGEVDLALQQLRKAGAIDLKKVQNWLLDDSMFDELRTHAHFKEFLGSVSPRDLG